MVSVHCAVDVRSLLVRPRPCAKNSGFGKRKANLEEEGVCFGATM